MLQRMGTGDDTRFIDMDVECVGPDGGKSESWESPDGDRYGSCVEDAGKGES